MLKLIRDDIKIKYWLTDVDALPNEQIIEKIKLLVLEESDNNSRSIQHNELLSDTGQSIKLWAIIGDIKAIDDQFIWTNSYWLFRWTGMETLINGSMLQDSEEAELFQPWKIVRVWSLDKLRTVWLIVTRREEELKNYIGKHYKVLGYNRDWFTIPDDKINNIIKVYNWNRVHKRVFVEDAFWNIYIFPQTALVRTAIKDLQQYQHEQLLKTIIEELQDNAKYEIETLTGQYQEDLRKFMEVSQKLQDKLSWDYKVEAERILEIQMSTKTILEKNEQIASVEYIPWQKLVVDTVPLWNSNQPIGRYRITLTLNAWWLKVFNLDIGKEDEYQHPHIRQHGDCCLGEWMNPMRESYSKRDYITLIASIINYIESLYERSVYMSMNDFQQKRGFKFKYQITTSIDETTAPTEDVVEQSSTTPEPRRVWSLVEIHTDNQSWHEIWTQGTIVKSLNHIGDAWYNYRVNAHGITYEHSQRFLTLISEPNGEAQAEDIDGN